MTTETNYSYKIVDYRLPPNSGNNTNINSKLNNVTDIDYTGMNNRYISGKVPIHLMSSQKMLQGIESEVGKMKNIPDNFNEEKYLNNLRTLISGIVNHTEPKVLSAIPDNSITNKLQHGKSGDKNNKGFNTITTIDERMIVKEKYITDMEDVNNIKDLKIKKDQIKKLKIKDDNLINALKSTGNLINVLKLTEKKLIVNNQEFTLTNGQVTQFEKMIKKGKEDKYYTVSRELDQLNRSIRLLENSNNLSSIENLNNFNNEIKNSKKQIIQIGENIRNADLKSKMNINLGIKTFKIKKITGNSSSKAQNFINISVESVKKILNSIGKHVELISKIPKSNDNNTNSKHTNNKNVNVDNGLNLNISNNDEIKEDDGINSNENIDKGLLAHMQSNFIAMGNKKINNTNINPLQRSENIHNMLRKQGTQNPFMDQLRNKINNMNQNNNNSMTTNSNNKINNVNNNKLDTNKS